MGPMLPRITEKFGLHGFLVLLTFIVWRRYNTCLHLMTMQKNMQMKGLRDSIVMLDKHVCTQQ